MKAVVLKLDHALGGLVKTQIAGPHLQGFWFTKSGLASRICMSDKFAGDAVLRLLVSGHYENHWIRWKAKAMTFI